MACSVPQCVVISGAILLAPLPVRAQVPPPASAVAAAPALAQITQSALDSARIENERAQARYYTKQANGGESRPFSGLLPTLLGGALTILGGVVASLLTNRNNERKSRGEQRRIFDRQRSQLRLAVLDLQQSLAKIDGQNKPAFLSERLIYNKFSRPETANRLEDYYAKYDLVNTIYRFCALLGWMELYRRDAAFLRGSVEENSQLQRCLAALRSDLADDFREEKKKSPNRPDGFVLEDDQRAIGEKMIARQGPDVVIGYAEFCEQLFRDPLRDNANLDGHPRSQNWWIWNMTRFFVEMGEHWDKNDFRRERIRKVVGNLNDLEDVLGATNRVGAG